MKKVFSDIIGNAENELLKVWKEQVTYLLEKSLKHPINWNLAGKTCWAVDITACKGSIYFYQGNEISVKVTSDFSLSGFKVTVTKASPEFTFDYCMSIPQPGMEFLVSPVNLPRLLNELLVIYPYRG